MNQVKRIGVSVSMVIAVFLAVAGTDNVLAESPIVTQMATAEIQQANVQASVAAAIDPITGNVALESAPMQCAMRCQFKVDERVNLCLNNAPVETVRAAGIVDPRNCMRESAQRYDACLTACGMRTSKPQARSEVRPSMPRRRAPHSSTPPAAAASVLGVTP